MKGLDAQQPGNEGKRKAPTPLPLRLSHDLALPTKKSERELRWRTEVGRGKVQGEVVRGPCACPVMGMLNELDAINQVGTVFAAASGGTGRSKGR